MEQGKGYAYARAWAIGAGSADLAVEQGLPLELRDPLAVQVVPVVEVQHVAPPWVRFRWINRARRHPAAPHGLAMPAISERDRASA
jgi:hypothetical protein